MTDGVGVGLHVVSDVSTLGNAVWMTLSGTYIPKHLEGTGFSARATQSPLLNDLKSSASCWPKTVHMSFLTRSVHSFAAGVGWST